MRTKEQALQVVATEIRKSVFETILNAQSGHLGGNSSSVELMTALYFGGFIKYDPEYSKNPMRDIVLVRGHEGPLRYKIFSLIGYIDPDELATYRKMGSRLQGHEDMELTPGVDISPSGSLGMILSYGVGAAVVAKRNNTENKVVVFLGDGEEQEGNVSEAARHAASLQLNNLICIIDQNGKQLSRVTSTSDGSTSPYDVWTGYGWDVTFLENGNDIGDVLETYERVFNNHVQKPRLIIAHTTKGLGLPGVIDHFNGAHTLGSYRNNGGVVRAIEMQDQEMNKLNVENGEVKRIVNSINLAQPKLETPRDLAPIIMPKIDIEVDEMDSSSLEGSQIHYFRELRKIIETNPRSPNFYILTPDFVLEPLVGVFELNKLGSYFDVGIREQHAMAMSHGISTSDPTARIVHFCGDAFLYRGLDQINAASQGKSKALIFSERAGITQERNGSSHQTISQPSSILNIPGIYFKEPGDVADLYNILNWFFTNNPGWVYLRTHSNKVSLLNRESADKKNINFYVVHDEDISPDVVIASSGLTLTNSIDAAKKLKVEKNINVRVINIVDPKSLGQNFNKLLVDRVPLLTFYNGSPALLQMATAKSVMESQYGARPSFIEGYGFTKGSSGGVKDLEKLFHLDPEGIANQVLTSLSK